MEVMTDDLSEVQPVSLDFSMAVDNDGNSWIAAQSVVAFFRAVSIELVSADGGDFTLEDVSAVMEIEADALELRALDMTMEMGS